MYFFEVSTSSEQLLFQKKNLKEHENSHIFWQFYVTNLIAFILEKIFY